MDKTFSIFDHLKANAIRVHFPTKKQGKCDGQYVVVKDMGKTSPNGVTGSGLVHLLIYTPDTNYEAIVGFTKQVKQVMQTLPNVKRTGMETPIIHEDLIEAFSTSVEYQYHKTI